MKIACTLLLFLLSCNTPNNNAVVSSSGKSPAMRPAIPAGFTSVKGSKNVNDILCQCWENDEDLEDSKQYGSANDVDMLFRGYCFYKDGIVVKHPRGYMDQGSWRLDSTTTPVSLKLRFGNGKEDILNLEQLKATKLKWRNKNEDEQFSATGLRHTNELDDPFFPANNKWRVKPTAAETPAQIKTRLKGCIHFFVLYYDQMINTNAATVSFAGYPSCFTWYAGGIYMQKKSELQQKWIRCFYNEQQAMEAYAFAEDLLQQKYTWPKGEQQWMKLNVAVLKQMEARLAN